MKGVKIVKGGFIDFPIVTFRERNRFISRVPDLYISSQGKTIEESREKLKEAVELFFEGEDIEKLLKEEGVIPSIDIDISIARFNIKRVKNGSLVPVKI